MEPSLPPVKIPCYKNNGYRVYHKLNMFFKMNPNNPLQGYISTALEIQDSYTERDNKELIEQANVMNPDL